MGSSPLHRANEAPTEHVEAFPLFDPARTLVATEPPPYQPKYEYGSRPVWEYGRTQYPRPQYKTPASETWFAKFLLGVMLVASFAFVLFVSFMIAHVYFGAAR